jgi:DNA-binding response OmpR family regulator
MRKILIIDDDHEIRELLDIYLKNNNYSTILAEDLKEAEEKLLQGHPDLILLDMYLPDGNGIEFLKKIKEWDIHAPVIMVTGAMDKLVALRSLEMGASDYITKPIDLPYLHTSIIAKLLTA